ncbi:MAG: PAS domain-containing protein [Muricauda sp.]|nr:PAS domain-containing protein [Allomuricauda sp.]MBA4744773.1 PAS domain-containing protein [Allomuricauda sp.]
MSEENSTYISPLLSFDLYLEAYHHLIKNLKKETDIEQLKYILKGNIGPNIQDVLRQEVYDALVLTSSDQQIIWVNNGFTEMTGYAKNYALGKKPTFLQGEQTSKSKIKDIGEQLHRKHGYTGSIVNYRKSGESYVCQIKILPLYDSKKELTHFIAMERELLSA